MAKRQKRTPAFKVRAYELFESGNAPVEAFAQACQEHGTTPSGCMTTYASSYMSDDIRRWIADKVEAGDQLVIALCKEANLLEE